MDSTVYNKADLHIHTSFSDGLMSPQTLVDYVATQTDLRVIAVTDHDTIEGAKAAKAYRDKNVDIYGHIEIIIGSEISSAHGEILGLFLTRDVPAGLSAAETIRRIHEQGGLAIAAHPFAIVMTMIGRAGMRGPARWIATLPFDGVEERNSSPTEFFGNPFTAWYNRRHQQLAATGGSDTHYLPTVGSTFTRFPGESAADLRHAIETKQTQAGGRVYSPLLIFNVIYDKLFNRLPDRQPAPPKPVSRLSLYPRL